MNECHKDPKGTKLCSDLAIKIYTILVKTHFFVLLVLMFLEMQGLSVLNRIFLQRLVSNRKD